MFIEQLIILAIVQGLTEFWPVSSSGHLKLVPLLTDWKDQGLLIDVAVHVGSLFAVMIYFWRDMIDLLKGFGDLVFGKLSPGARFLVGLILASIPLAIIGFILLQWEGYDNYRTMQTIALANIIFALLLYWYDSTADQSRTLDQLTWRDALIIGCAQVLALIPGSSRSGVTMTAGRALNFNRLDAARYAMLLSIPAILGAGLGAGYKLHQSGDAALQTDAIFVAVLSFVSALLAIWFMMALLRRMTMLPFVIYRLILGGLLLGLIYL